jgi:predicted nucleic acid-binding Zn ribbon protein
MVRCQSCGTDNPDDSKFCTGCGATLLAAAPAGEARCSACGATLPPDSRFCVACGRPADAGGAPAHCINCGAKLEPGSAFCTACGTPLVSAAAPAGGAARPLPAAGDMDAALTAYWTGLSGRLGQGGFEVVGQTAGLDADRVFKRQRFDLAKAGKVTTLCAVKWVPAVLNAEAVRSYSQAVFNFASSQKALLGRSSYLPLVVYPVLVSPACPPDVQAFLSSHWPKRFQAYEFPVVVALATKEIFCHRSTPVWGMAFHAGFVREAGSLFQP